MVAISPLDHSANHSFDEEQVSARYLGHIGWGLVAAEAFAPGDCIFWINPEESARLTTIPQSTRFGSHVGWNFTHIPGYTLLVSPKHPLWFVNHSCRPNSGFRNWGRLESYGLSIVAYRDIAGGEPITVDYATFTAATGGNSHRYHWEMSPCLCGQPNCRKTITDFSRLSLDQQLHMILPESRIQGRVLAHLLSDLPVLIASLRHVAPRQYAVYLEALRQQNDLAYRFHTKLDQ